MKKKIAPALLIVLALTGCSPPPKPAPEPAPRPRAAAVAMPTGSATQPFDYYLLNLSWSPEFCFSHRTPPSAPSHPAFVLHGLWPQNNDGTYPQNCSNAPGPADPSQYADIYPDPGLLRHEWSTHGTCSGLSPDDFFTAARAAFRSVAIPSTLSQLDHQISMPPARFSTSSPPPTHPSQLQPCPLLRQQLPHRHRGLPEQKRPSHRLRSHPFLPRQHRPHPTAIIKTTPAISKESVRFRGIYFISK